MMASLKKFIFSVLILHIASAQVVIVRPNPFNEVSTEHNTENLLNNTENPLKNLESESTTNETNDLNSIGANEEKTSSTTKSESVVDGNATNQNEIDQGSTKSSIGNINKNENSTILPETNLNASTVPVEIITTEAPTTLAHDFLIPPASVDASIAQIEPIKKGENDTSGEHDCPSLADADSLSQTQLLQRLTHGCRYDRLERPITFNLTQRLPVKVHVRAYVYFLQNLEAHDLQFKMHALLQMRFVDPRLVFKEVAPKRKQPILGEKSLRDTLWVPHVFFANERDSSILGTAEKDILTSISPDGTVIISTRIQASLYCWMNLQKFPFDEQTCSTILESWMYNTSELILHWEDNKPITFDPKMHLTEYVMVNAWTNDTIINADLNDLRHGAFAGHYSSLSFTVHLTREIGYYLMDYFLPSMMIVAISWVSFWLQADQSAPRIMLGTSTMLTFITLASAQGKTLPKVSYIKVSEVWFLGCTGFIFGSLVEFAFVNTIWRRKKNVELKKINSKYIFKSTLTPRLARKDLGNLQKSRSCSSLEGSSNEPNTTPYNNYLTVHTLPIITTQSEEDFSHENGHIKIDVERGSNNNMSGSIKIHDSNEKNKTYNWTTMTPQQISMWIDKRARFIFPLAFLFFNVLFWTFVYCL